MPYEGSVGGQVNPSALKQLSREVRQAPLVKEGSRARIGTSAKKLLNGSASTSSLPTISPGKSPGGKAQRGGATAVDHLAVNPAPMVAPIRAPAPATAYEPAPVMAEPPTEVEVE